MGDFGQGVVFEHGGIQPAACFRFGDGGWRRLDVDPECFCQHLEMGVGMSDCADRLGCGNGRNGRKSHAELLDAFHKGDGRIDFGIRKFPQPAEKPFGWTSCQEHPASFANQGSDDDPAGGNLSTCFPDRIAVDPTVLAAAAEPRNRASLAYRVSWRAYERPQFHHGLVVQIAGYGREKFLSRLLKERFRF